MDRGWHRSATANVISAIYEAALEPARWQEFVNTLAGEFDGIAPVFYLADTRSALMETLLVANDWGGSFRDPYMAHYNGLNPWSAGLAGGIGAVGEGVSGNDIISQSALKNTEFYNDFFKSFGDWTGVVGVVVHRDPHAFSVLGIHCSAKKYDHDSIQLYRLAEQLAPHIQRAFRISRELQHGAMLKATLEQTLENLTCAALVVREDLRVVYANSEAEALFSTNELRLDSGGRLVAAAGAAATDALQQSLRCALGLHVPAHAAPPIFLTRTGIDEDVNAPLPLIAQIMPISRCLQADLAARIFMPPFPAQALMLVSDPGTKPELTETLLELLFGLTPAETRLAIAFSDGWDLNAYANANGITRGTARSQLKAIFAKTGVHRQAELAALLSRIAGPIKLTF